MSDEMDPRLKLSEEMQKDVQYWKSIVINLTRRTREDHLKDVIDIQAEAISYRQEVIEKLRTYSIRIHKLVQKLKLLHKAKFEFYSTSYQIKTNGTEKLRLIEADLSEHQLLINELDEHVNFLRDTAKNLESINYSIKGKIELYNIIGA